MFSTCPDEAARDGAASPPSDPSRPLPPGRGVFAVPLPAHGRDAAIRVYYYLPPAERFDPARTPVLFVLHGLQRNAVDYFDALMASGALPVRESGEEEENSRVCSSLALGARARSRRHAIQVRNRIRL